MSIRPIYGEGGVRSRDSHTEFMHRSSWVDASITLDRRRWVCDETELHWTAPQHVIILTEQGRTSRTRIQAGGSLVYDGEDRPGAVSFVPAGVEREGMYQNADLTYSALWIDPDCQVPGCEKLAHLPTMVNGSDTVIETLLRCLFTELAAGHQPDSAYIEHLAVLAALRVSSSLAGAQNMPLSPVLRHAPLHRRTLARVDDFIEAHMDGDISLSDLAALADMPVDTFARRFRSATGQAPYAYVIERRIARARQLLATTDTPIGQLALSLGFSSQSHFTTTFRRLNGMTPRVFRAQSLPGR